MPRRLHSHSTEQTIIDFDAPPPEPVTLSSQQVAEPEPPEYSVSPAWIDTAGRTRTWSLTDPHGTQMAEITTKRDAHKLAVLLSRVMGSGRGSSR